QQSALRQGLLRHCLAVEHPAGGSLPRRAVVGASQGQRQRAVKCSLIGGLEKGQLLVLGEGGQDADDVPQDRAAWPVKCFLSIDPSSLRRAEDRQVIQAGGYKGMVGPESVSLHLEAAFEERLGLTIPALVPVQ